MIEEPPDFPMSQSYIRFSLVDIGPSSAVTERTGYGKVHRHRDRSKRNRQQNAEQRKTGFYMQRPEAGQLLFPLNRTIILKQRTFFILNYAVSHDKAFPPLLYASASSVACYVPLPYSCSGRNVKFLA